MAADCFFTRTIGHALIRKDDHHATALAEKHNLTRANTCGGLVRQTGAAACFNGFMKEVR